MATAVPWAPRPATPLSDRLETLVESSTNWTYAIFWAPSVDPTSGAARLVWGDGYFRPENDHDGGNPKPPTSPAELADREHRKRVLLRELNRLNFSVPGPDDYPDDFAASEWFFIASMSKSFSRLVPGWIAAATDELVGSPCARVREARVFGMQTLVWVPALGGILELGSTELILCSQQRREKLMSRINSLRG